MKIVVSSSIMYELFYNIEFKRGIWKRCITTGE